MARAGGFGEIGVDAAGSKKIWRAVPACDGGRFAARRWDCESAERFWIRRHVSIDVSGS